MNATKLLPQLLELAEREPAPFRRVIRRVSVGRSSVDVLECLHVVASDRALRPRPRRRCQECVGGQ